MERLLLSSWKKEKKTSVLSDCGWDIYANLCYISWWQNVSYLDYVHFKLEAPNWGIPVLNTDVIRMSIREFSRRKKYNNVKFSNMTFSRLWAWICRQTNGFAKIFVLYSLLVPAKAKFGGKVRRRLGNVHFSNFQQKEGQLLHIRTCSRISQLQQSATSPSLVAGDGDIPSVLQPPLANQLSEEARREAEIPLAQEQDAIRGIEPKVVHIRQDIIISVSLMKILK